MAGGLVRSAISAILTDSNFSKESERWKVAKQETVDFLQEISDDQGQRMTEFDEFAVKLMQLLEQHCTSALSGSSRSRSVLKEKAWIAFHQLRISELPKVWIHFTTKLSSLIYQHVNYKLYAELVKSKLCRSAPPYSTHTDIQISEDEENIIRYAAGYVPFKLMKKYEKSSDTQFAISVIECLSNMSINGDESDLLEYSRKWTMLVNRGGLFELNDLSYTMFKEIECQVRHQLHTTFSQKSSSNNRREIIEAVSNTDDVQFYWTILSVDIPVEEHAMQLLEEIVGLWVTIRGFSIAGGWLETYKHITKVNTARSKALRKDLKQKGTTATSDD